MSFVKSRTNKGDLYWFKRIDKLIVKHSRKGKVNKAGFYHDETDPLAWLKDLAKELMKEFPGGYRDENMWMASLVSFILMKWFVALVRAKSYDPRRRLVDRKRMLKLRTEFCKQVVEFMLDESKDAVIFPKQQWDAPFSATAKDGKYQ